MRPSARPKRRRRYVEDADCRAFYEWYLLTRPQFLTPCLVCHIPNQSARSGRAAAIEGAKLNAMGRRKGMLDYVVFANGTAFLLEFKTKGLTVAGVTLQHSGSLSDDQKRVMAEATECGIDSYVVRGCVEAIAVFRQRAIIP